MLSDHIRILPHPFHHLEGTSGLYNVTIGSITVNLSPLTKDEAEDLAAKIFAGIKQILISEKIYMKGL